MDLKSNLLNDELPLLGSFLGIPSPAIVEMLGQAGYDFLILDTEHGALSPESLENCLRAARSVNLPCVVRVADLEANLIQTALDLGADGVQVPQIETASQAKKVVEFSNFPPAGKRGYGSATRAAAYGFRPRPLIRELAQRELLTTIQIESKAGVENLPSILEIPGIDVVFIGTSDLSLDYGYELPSDPAMIPLINEVISAINVAGKVPGIHISDWSRLGQLHESGVKYFTTSAPIVMKESFTSQVKDFADRLKKG